MNKLTTFYRYRKNICKNKKVVFLFYITLLLFSSCGLEEFREIDPPRNAIQANQSDGTIGDLDIVDSPEHQKFEFTAVANASSGFIAPGTEIYYRIYNNVNDLQSDASSINDANIENTNNGFTRLEALRYISLGSNPTSTPLIRLAGRVIVRPFVNPDLSTDYIVGIFLDTTRLSTPLRYDGEIFNFNPNTANDLQHTLPQNGDNDYKFSTASDGKDFWYVNAYAVSIGLDSTTFTPTMSEVLPLGFIAYTQKIN